MDESDLLASPRKKLKAQHVLVGHTMEATSTTSINEMTDAPITHEGDSASRLSKEAQCGITEFVSPDLPGFTGVLKKRYTDFLVNEILPSGQVVHLDNLKAARPGKQAKHEPATLSGLGASSEREANDHQPQSGQAHDVKNNDQNPPLLMQSPAGLPDDSATSREISERPVTQEQQIETEVLQQSPTEEPEDSNRAEKVVPVRSTPEPVSASEKNVDASAHPWPTEPAAITRRKEKVIIRQTNTGIVVVGDQKDIKTSQPVGTEQFKNDEREESLVPAEAGYDPASSSTADWQTYAKTSKGTQLSLEDKQLLTSFFGPEVRESILTLYNHILDSPHRSAKDYGKVISSVIDRETRTKIHQAVRRIFESRLETTTDDSGAMILSAAASAGAAGSGRNSMAPARNLARGNGRSDGRNGGRNDGGRKPQPKGKLGWQELGGEYLHFSLFKENKDTMEVVAWLAKTLKTKPQAFQFAGTKDRRGVTVQRVSIYRVFADRMVAAGRTLRNATIGNYEYQPMGLQLGELTGNEFVITLRDCQFEFSVDVEDTKRAEQASKLVGTALMNLKERGFINYYGLQRFGTFSTRTDDVGIKILQGDFQAAVEAILDFNPTCLAAAQDPMSSEDKISRDDRARAYAINSFKTTGRSQPALEEMPRKFSAETNIIRHLGSTQHKGDYPGALQTIPRNLRLMYVHAYQSLVWNVVASERWRLFGDMLLEGDLVLVEEHKGKLNRATSQEDVDADGEVVVHPAGDDRAANVEDFFTRARALTKDDIESDKYSIFDVVLPTPGYDILYPANQMEWVYETFMGSERGGKLDPHDMRRKWKDSSLSGSYRKLLARPGNDVKYEIKSYSKEDEQFVETDLDRLSKSGHRTNDRFSNSTGPLAGQEESGVDAVKKLAVVLTLQLGSSQYATMALRELMKSGGVKTYKPDFGSGR